MSDQPGPKRAVKTTETSIGILDVLTAESALTLEELTERFEHSRSTIHRHLATLEKHGLVVRDDGAYRLGLRLLDFGKRAQERSELYDVSKDFVKRLANETGDHVWLSSLESYHSVVVCSIVEDRPFEGDFLTGVRRKLHQSAGGMAMLASFDDEQVRTALEASGVDESVYAPGADLWDDLERFRADGYALRATPDSGKVTAIAKAIRTESEGVVGAIGIADTKGRSGDVLVEDGYPEDVIQASNEIEILLRLPE